MAKRIPKQPTYLIVVEGEDPYGGEQPFVVEPNETLLVKPDAKITKITLRVA